MADENKNQDPEEENKGASNDDDFGLPDFEFEALDDDDDDEAEETVENDAAPEPPKEEPAPSTDAEDELPSIDDGDLEDLDLDLDDVDLEGIEDVDLDDLDDLGDLDLDDLDLEDLDKDLEGLDSSVEETDTPQPASAEKIEDVFDDPRPTSKEEEEPLEDDGEFYEEESFGDFDDADFSEDTDLIADSSDDTSQQPEEPAADADELEGQLEEIGEPGELPEGDYSDDFDSSIFDDDTEGLDLGSGADEPVPFAKRDLPPEYQSSSDEEVDDISQEEIGASKGKFVRIVVLGTVLFLAIGFGFLYWYSDGNLGQYFGGEPSQEVAEHKESKPAAKKTEKPAEKKETTKPAETANNEEDKPASSTPATSQPKQQPKTETKKTEQPKQQTQQPKKTTTKPASSSSSGVATLGATTGQRHIIVGSFLDEASAQAFAGKLAGQGESPSVIPPFNGAPNYRVSVASFASFTEANSNLESFRERFSGAWILKY